MIAKFSGGPGSSTNRSVLIANLGGSRQLFLRTPYTYNTSQGHGYAGIGCYYGSTSYSQDASADQPIRSTSQNNTYGVLGCSFTNNSATIYINGIAYKFTGTTGKIDGITGGVRNGDFSDSSPRSSRWLIGMRTHAQRSGEEMWNSMEKWYWQSFYLQYIAFYNITLTDSQQSQIARQIDADSGS